MAEAQNVYVSFLPEQLVFRENDPANEMFYILEGSVEVFKEIEGRKISLGGLQKGEVFGEMGLLEAGCARTASVQAVSEVKLLVLNKDEFFKRIKENPQFCLNILKSLSLRLQKANEELMVLKFVVSG